MLHFNSRNTEEYTPMLHFNSRNTEELFKILV